MKGLAKKNNKTRGKTNRRKKNNRKTNRKGNKRGGSGFEIEIPLSQQKAELMDRKKTAKINYQKILDGTLAELNTIKIEFKNYVDEIRRESGYTETKDENQHPNKKTKYNDPDGLIKKAEVKLEEIMNSLNEKSEIAARDYHAEINKIEKEFSIINKKEKELQETADINAKKDAKIDEEIEKNKRDGKYIDPSNDRFYPVSQEEELTRGKFNESVADNKEYDERVKYGLYFNGGKKRKTYKKRK